MKVVSNGNSYMEFNMQVTAVGVRDSASDKSANLGTWHAGFNNNLSLENPLIMNNYTADVVYRIVTVVVSDQTKISKISLCVTQRHFLLKNNTQSVNRRKKYKLFF